MKKHQLQALVAVAEHGSIRRAANAVALSQTALTKALREMELDLQAVLLQRSPQGVRLTPIGLQLLHHAKLILSEMDEARASVRHMLGLGDPPVKVAVTPTFSLLCLAETVARFRTRFSKASLENAVSALRSARKPGCTTFSAAAVAPRLITTPWYPRFPALPER